MSLSSAREVTQGIFNFWLIWLPNFANIQGCNASHEARSPTEENGKVECSLCAFQEFGKVQ